MEINKGRTRSTLFVKVHTAHQELWEGKRAGTAGSVELTGIENAETVHRLGSYLRSITQVKSGGCLRVYLWLCCLLTMNNSYGE